MYAWSYIVNLEIKCITLDKMRESKPGAKQVALS